MTITYPVKCKMHLRGDKTVTYFEVERKFLELCQEMRTASDEEIEEFFDLIDDSEQSYLANGVLYDEFNKVKTDFVAIIDKKGWVKVEGEEQDWVIGSFPSKSK